MKTLRKLLIAVLSSALIVCMGLFVAACDEGEEKEYDGAYYTVTADFDPEMGLVTVSAPASEQGYKSGESVTVTVTASEGYAISKVTVNGAAASGSGTVTFTVTENTVVKVTFKATGETPPPSADSYTVDLRVNNEEYGSADLSAPQSGDKYAAGEEVTVTATPKKGYRVRQVAVNGKPIDPNAEGKYVFSVTVNSTVTVYFAVDDSDLPDTNISFSASWTGTWISTDGEHRMYFAENKMSLDGVGVSTFTESSNTAGEGYDFVSGSSEYLLTWADGYYSIGYILLLRDYTAHKSTYFIESTVFNTPLSILEDHWGTWYVGDEATLVIDETSVIYRGVDMDVVVDIGHLDASLDGWNSPIDSNVYLLLGDDTFYIMLWYPDGNCPVIGDDYFSRNPQSASYTPPRDYLGTWKGVGSETRDLVIREDGVTLGGEEVEYGRGELGALSVTDGGKQYDVLSFGDFALYFRTYSFNEQGLPIGWTDSIFFVTANHPTDLSLPTEYYGTWKAAGRDDLVIGADTLKWGDLDGEVIGRTELGGDVEGGISPTSAEGSVQAAAETEGPSGYLYTVTFGDKVYLITGKADSLHVEGTKEAATFTKGSVIPAEFKGNWNADGTESSSIVVTDEKFELDGTTYSLLPGAYGVGYTFTKDGTLYTVTLLEGYEAYVLCLSHTEEGRTVTVSYLTDREIPTVSVENSDLYGEWTDGEQRLAVTPTQVTLNNLEGTLLGYDGESDFYVFYANGTVYTMKLGEDGTSVALRVFGSESVGSTLTQA